jgi:hypothetical protein
VIIQPKNTIVKKYPISLRKGNFDDVCIRLSDLPILYHEICGPLDEIIYTPSLPQIYPISTPSLPPSYNGFEIKSTPTQLSLHFLTINAHLLT